MWALLQVTSGSVLGAAARYSITFLFPGIWTLCLINIFGCWLMGRFQPGLFLGTGVLGGFTSFSAFQLAMFEHPAYLAITVAGCIGAWHLGNRTCSNS